MDESAEAIVEKWRNRLAKGWAPSVSDVVRHLDSLAEAREAELAQGRRLRVK